MGYKLSNNYVRIYTTGMPMWAPSFRLVDFIHDGRWNFRDDKRHMTDDDYWPMLEFYLPKGKWKCTL